MSTETMLDRVLAVTKELEGYKKVWTELDELTAKLMEIGFKTAIYKGHTINLVDNFKDKNCVFRATGVRRFEIKVE